MKSPPWTFDDGGRTEAGYRGKAGDCFTRSLAIATGADYQTVYNAVNVYASFEKLGKRYAGKSSARTGVHRPTARQLMTDLGWLWVPHMGIGTGVTVHLRKGEVPSAGRYILSLSRHFTALVDGVVRDTFDPSRDGTRAVYGWWVQPEGGKS